MRTEQGLSGRDEDMARQLAKNQELSYWVRAVQDGQVPPEEVDEVKAGVEAMLAKDSAIDPYVLAGEALYERAWQIAEDRAGVLEAMRGQT